MTGSLLTFLTQALQDSGIYPDDYSRVVNAMSTALIRLDKQMQEGDAIEFPSGRVLIASRRVGLCWHNNPIETCPDCEQIAANNATQRYPAYYDKR